MIIDYDYLVSTSGAYYDGTKLKMQPDYGKGMVVRVDTDKREVICVKKNDKGNLFLLDNGEIARETFKPESMSVHYDGKYIGGWQ